MAYNGIGSEEAYNAAINRRMRENARKGRGARWMTPEREVLVQKMHDHYYGYKPFEFITAMYDNFQEWGSLTEKQEAAVVRFFEKDEAKKAEWKAVRMAEGAVSEFVGDEKVRGTFRLILNKIFQRESDFGTQFIHNFKDEAGNIIVWQGTKALDMPLGEAKDVIATVKSHYTNRDGIKTTYINRAKLA
jgi:hypothetical protein